MVAGQLTDGRATESRTHELRRFIVNSNVRCVMGGANVAWRLNRPQYFGILVEISQDTLHATRIVAPIGAG